MTQSSPKKLPISWLKNITHRELGRASTPYFMGYYLDMWMLPHRRQLLNNIEADYQYMLELWPRDHWKTTTVTGKIIKALAYDPSLRVLCVSNTKELALQNVGAIKAPFENNPRILRDFGDLRGEPWGTEKFTLKRPPSPRKEPSCIARSLGASALGMHFDIIWCDDIVTTETQWTDEQRKKVWAWFTGTLLRCLDRAGKLIVTGTRKHINDLYDALLSSKGWHSHVYKAIITDDPPQVLASWLYDYPRLQQESHRMGALMFAQEMQNEPVAAEGLELKKEWIHYYDPAKPPNFNWIYMGVDPAVGKSDTASYTAVVLIGVTPDLRFYVLDMQRHRWHIEWEDRIIELWQRYCNEGKAPLVVAVESVMTFQYVTLPLVEKSSMPVRFVDYRQKGDTQIKDKLARIRALGLHFEHGKVYLPDPDQYPMTITFEKEEYLIFPEKEGHTDLLDALNLAINEAPRSVGDETFWGI